MLAKFKFILASCSPKCQIEGGFGELLAKIKGYFGEFGESSPKLAALPKIQRAAPPIRQTLVVYCSSILYCIEKPILYLHLLSLMGAIQG